MNYVFGPVPSRRLGRSLGLDVTPRKVCTLDCVYCQVAATDVLTVERKAWVPTDAVLDEVRAFFRRGGVCDWVTFAGSGEPTLHADIGRMIRTIRDVLHRPVAVITNGTLLYDPAVRADLLEADLVMPNVDAGDPATFAAVNRPAPGLTYGAAAAGLVEFSREYKGRLVIEVFLVPGGNTDRAALEGIAALIGRLARHDGIELNYARRPAHGSGIACPAAGEFDRAEAILSTVGPVVRLDRPADLSRGGAVRPLTADELIDVLRRHPSTAEEIAKLFGATPDAVRLLASRLSEDGRLNVSAEGYLTAV